MSLFTSISRLAFSMAGHRYQNANDETWKWSMAWDYEQANDSAIWDAETEQELLREAIALAETCPERAFRTWFALAEQGSIWAMEEVGRCFASGVGVPRDAKQSEDWYRRAMEGGSQRAMLRYTELLRARRDYVACEAAVRAEADQDWPPAIFWLAWYRLKQSQTPETYLAALPLLERAALNGHPSAKWLLGRYMAQGRFGLGEILRGQKLMWRQSGALVERIMDR